MVTNKIAIEVKNVTKSFRIYHEKRNSIYETITSSLNRKKNFEDLTVLEDVSFSLNKGEMIGIIGLNGSGKSTLLRLLAGIYSPNRGKIIRYGTTIPFLELGSGFQPDLTAKDNIILYGLILGFTKKQIKEKMDEIIKFAELEKFADTKIKNFSSGMFARLAFSTAIQVDPDILLIDEILSVGDLPFQKKSFETFLSFKKRNKSIIFVSHNLETVKDLCDKAIFIHKGKIHSIGNPVNVINAYRSVVDNMSTIQQIRSNATDQIQSTLDSDIFEFRPWFSDFSKLGFNTGLETISIPSVKSQKFIEPIIFSYLEKCFSASRNEKPSVLSIFCYDDGYYPLYLKKISPNVDITILSNEQNHVDKAKIMIKKLNLKDVDVKLQDIHSFDKRDQFDIVLNINGLHMVNDPENILRLTKKSTKQFAIIQSIVSLDKGENYFETPAPGWTWGCRFSEDMIKKWIENLDWEIIEFKKNILEHEPIPRDKGSVYFLCKNRHYG